MAAVDSLLFVSKRVSAVAAALLCLIAAHLATAAVAAPASPSGEVRVTIRR